MIDGNGTAASETSRAAKHGVAKPPLGWAGLRAWRELEAEDRLALVESALRTAANDVAGELPVAL